MKQRVRRIISVVLTASICVSLVPNVIGSGTVLADESDWNDFTERTCLGTSAMVSPSAPGVDSEWTGNKVYFGNDTKGRRITFRVLAPSTTEYGGKTLFLDAAENLMKRRFDDNSNVWNGSELQEYLNGEFYNESFSDVEKAAIVTSKQKEGAAYPSGSYLQNTFGSRTGLNDKVFILDASDVVNESYGYSSDPGYEKTSGNAEYNSHIVDNHKKSGASSGYWWLRSACSFGEFSSGLVDWNGDISYSFVTEEYGVAPAINIDLNSILFSNIFSYTGKLGEAKTSYYLTLRNSNLSIGLQDGQHAMSVNDTTIAVPYEISGEDADSATRATVLILDKQYATGNTNNANILFYHTLEFDYLGGSFHKSGLGTFDLPSSFKMSDWGKKYYVYILAEKTYTSSSGSAYASDPVMISAPKSNFDSFTWNLSSNGDLFIKCFAKYIHLDQIGEDNLSKVKSITVDISELSFPVDSIKEDVENTNPYSYVSYNYIEDTEYLILYGSECKVSSMKFVCGNNDKFYMSLHDFPSLDGSKINVPQDVSLQRLMLWNTGISSLDFLSGRTVDEIEFNNCNKITQIVVPDTVGHAIFRCCDSLEKAAISSPETYYKFSACTLLSDVSLPQGITSIEYATFRGCNNLKTIELPDTVTRLKHESFWDSGIESITLPSSIEYIDHAAFNNCLNLKSFVIPSGIKYLSGTFYSCSSLESVYIPESVIEIADDPFGSRCDSLKDIYFGGTKEQWESIKIHGTSDVKTIYDCAHNAEIHFNSKGLPTPTPTPTKKPTATPTSAVKPKSTWKQEGNNWYYYDAKGSKVTGWQMISSTWYFFDNKGVMQTGWIESAGKWYYMKDTGAMALGWIQDGGKWYYMSASGAMATGWVQAGDKWYFMGASGAMATGWIQSGKYWYYMSASGAMATGWVQSGKTWYFMNESGAMVTGWQRAGIYWYYFESSGAMKTGWLETSGAKYYLADSGAMVTGKQTIGGKSYEFNSSGALIK